MNEPTPNSRRRRLAEATESFAAGEGTAAAEDRETVAESVVEGREAAPTETLSMTGSLYRLGWARVAGEEVVGTVIGWNGQGLLVEVEAVTALCPYAEIEVGSSAEPAAYLDRELSFRVIGIDEGRVLLAHERSESAGSALPTRDAELLHRGGLELETAAPRSDPVARTAAEFARLVDSGLTVAEAAARLGVQPSRIRQRLGDRTLYGIRRGNRWRLPEFQFDGDRQVPGLARVLPRLDPDLSPVAVVRWFTGACPDLETAEFARPLSPREWLLTGHPVEQVARLADRI